MKVKELREIVVYNERVVLYKSDKNDFEDVYKGYFNNDMPVNILNLEVCNIGAGSNGILDIKVK